MTQFQQSLFKQPAAEQIDLADGTLQLYHNLLQKEGQPDYYLNKIIESTPWRQDQALIFGKRVPIPRLQAWFGDPDRRYRYSSIELQPLPWTPLLLEIKARVETVSADQFNSVLINLYRNGSDSVAWHSDDEPELGGNPVIASVSFGATRNFLLKHKTRPTLPRVKLALTNGSLLIMSDSLQHHWLHSVPKTSRLIGPRINLTFRKVITQTGIKR